MADNAKSKVISGFIWRFAERCGAQLVGFIVSVILARILEPRAYGTIALITVFTTILQVFVDSGLGAALIQKKNADDLDFSTVFYANIAFCSILYMVMFFSAPYIARFYKDMSLTPLVRVLSLTIVISGVKSIQQSYVSRRMIFKRFFFATLGGTITAAVIGIWMAYNGFGVWALVAQQIINLTIDTIILWITVKWRPKRMFSFQRLKGLYSFGWKILVVSLLDTVLNDVRQLIIGKMYTAENLAYYNRAKQIPNIVVTNINTSIDSVLFPAFSKAQSDKNTLRSMVRRSMKTSTYIMAPLMIGIAFIAKPIVSLLLTDKWLPCVPFIRIFCVTYMFRPIHTANLNAIKALGRSDILLKLEIIKKIVGILLLITTMWFGIMVMAYSLLFSNVVYQIINAWPNKKLIGYKYMDQIRDIIPGILLAVFMGFCVSFITYIGLPDTLTIILQTVFGAGIYIMGSRILKLEAFYYICGIMEPVSRKLKKKKTVD